MPTLFDNDIIISSYLHRINWQSKINSAHIFIVIHNNGIVVKRLTNRLREEQCILLHSIIQTLARILCTFLRKRKLEGGS